MLSQEQQDNIHKALGTWDNGNLLSDVGLPGMYDDFCRVCGIPTTAVPILRAAGNRRNRATAFRAWLGDNGYGYVLAGVTKTNGLTDEQAKFIECWLSYLEGGWRGDQPPFPGNPHKGPEWQKNTGLPVEVHDRFLDLYKDNNQSGIDYMRAEVTKRRSGASAPQSIVTAVADPQRVVIDELCAWYEGGKVGDMPFMPLDSDWEKTTGLPLSVRKEAAEAFMQNAHSGTKVAGIAYARVLRVAIGQLRPIAAAPVQAKVIPDPEPLKPKLDAEKIFHFDYRQRIDTSKIIAS